MDPIGLSPPFFPDDASQTLGPKAGTHPPAPTTQPTPAVPHVPWKHFTTYFTHYPDYVYPGDPWARLHTAPGHVRELLERTPESTWIGLPDAYYIRGDGVVDKTAETLFLWKWF